MINQAENISAELTEMLGNHLMARNVDESI